MSTADELDVLLYAWLSEREARRADLLFRDYFRAAFPAICRFVRAFHTDAETAQDVAQQALIKLFIHLGTERNALDGRLREAVAELSPLELGPLHVRRVGSWREQVTSFRDAAVGFRLPARVSGAGGPWKEMRDAINRRIPPLMQQGVHFLEEVRKRVEMNFADAAETVSTTNESHSGAVPWTDESQDTAEGESFEPAVRRFVENVLHGALLGDAAHDGALSSAGITHFVTRTNTICISLPALAIPSNGLLYTIAKRQLLDQLRARRPERAAYVQQLVDTTAAGVLDEMESGGVASRENDDPESPVWADFSQMEVVDDEDADVEVRYRAFLEFLRAPLTRAEAALEAAAARGAAKMERARVESLRAKYDRLLAVLAALQESPQPTEEDIAQRLGLTRNQVKYVIERVREDFNGFFPDLAREAQGRRKRQGAET